MSVRPNRSPERNTARDGSSLPVFTVILARPCGGDRSQLLLRDTFESRPEQAKKFAVKMLDGGTHRYGLPLDAQVFDVGGVLVFACDAGLAR
tara:strand:+ start:2772 stop:3047 length:276 start_codon:yes stop_codon:yes gene_type:complete